jgi:hypothetical protein
LSISQDKKFWLQPMLSQDFLQRYGNSLKLINTSEPTARAYAIWGQARSSLAFVKDCNRKLSLWLWDGTPVTSGLAPVDAEQEEMICDVRFGTTMDYRCHRMSLDHDMLCSPYTVQKLIMHGMGSFVLKDSDLEVGAHEMFGLDYLRC